MSFPVDPCPVDPVSPLCLVPAPAQAGHPPEAAQGRSGTQAGHLRTVLEGCDWAALEAELDAWGYARLPGLLPPSLCRALAADYARDELYRSRVTMARHGFGQGEYRYYRYPLPAPVQWLRERLYARLAPIASRWRSRSAAPLPPYPPQLQDYLAQCRAAGQRRPTPLQLRYVAGDYNCLHQDLYGEWVFPLQAACLLSEPGRDFEGGEFVLTEQRPRRQSRVEVVPLRQGDAVVFAVDRRPVRGVRGWHSVAMRHGVSRLRSGQRHTLGLIFHDAR